MLKNKVTWNILSSKHIESFPNIIKYVRSAVSWQAVDESPLINAFPTGSFLISFPNWFLIKIPPSAGRRAEVSRRSLISKQFPVWSTFLVGN